MRAPEDSRDRPSVVLRLEDRDDLEDPLELLDLDDDRDEADDEDDDRDEAAEDSEDELELLMEIRRVVLRPRAVTAGPETIHFSLAGLVLVDFLSCSMSCGDNFSKLIRTSLLVACAWRSFCRCGDASSSSTAVALLWSTSAPTLQAGDGGTISHTSEASEASSSSASNSSPSESKS